MTTFYEQAIEIIKEELHELKHLNIKVELTEHPLDKSKKIKPNTGLCWSKPDFTTLDENGTPITKYKIELNTNNFAMDKLYKRIGIVKDVRTRTEEYLNGIGVEFTEEVMFVTVALHEFGHAVQQEKFRYYGMREAYINYNKINTQTTELVFGHRNMVKSRKITNQSLRYHLNPAELNADNFVFLKFPRIWNKVKHLVEVK